MSKRTYNVYFHLHTVTGIVMTIGLFVIFFAGAFTLFVSEIQQWEAPPEKALIQNHGRENRPLDLDKLVAALKAKGYDLYGRNIYTEISKDGLRQSVYVSGVEDSLASEEAKEGHQLWLDKETYEISERKGSAGLGSLLYELHFFYQLGDVGYYLSGVVSLFFLFALVTGIIVHWKKIVSNFYLFRPQEKLKTVWTDAHTALGTIGIPFQFMYAVTGAMFGLGILVATSGGLLYGGDERKFYDELYGAHDETLGPRIDMADYSLNTYVDSASSYWEDFTTTFVSVSKCESSTMQLAVYGNVPSEKRFYNDGEIVFDVIPGTINHLHDPYHKPFDETVWPTVYKLHYAEYDLAQWPDFGLKALYFLMALATCFVIITGVLIWLEARNKKSIPEKERKFNEGVGYIYLAICLSMFPVTAFSSIVTKLLPERWDNEREVIVNSVFFGSWLLASVFLWLKKDNYFVNKYTLLSGGIIGLIIPLVSGFYTQNWPWVTFSRHQYDIFIVDLLWIVLAATALLAVRKMQKKKMNYGTLQNRKHAVNSADHDPIESMELRFGSPPSTKK